MEMRRKRVLVVGGSGYLGQHLLQELSVMQKQGSAHIAFTSHSNSSPQIFPEVPSFPLDLRSDEGFHSITSAFGEPDVVVNCAALSVPRTCEMDPTAAMSINVPTALVKWLSSFKTDCLLIQLSTDQVYEGVKSFYKEEDETVPVNVYGRSKLEAEQFIMKKCSNYAILRSSIIYGPQTLSPVSKSLPIQWMDSVLSKGEEVNFFYDEYRCPVYVKDVVNVITSLIRRWFAVFESNQMQLLLNVGGPDRVSRAQMAEAVAIRRGYNVSLIKPVSASSVDRGVKSPADISMDCTKLKETLAVYTLPFSEGVRLTLHAETGPL